MNDLKKVIGDVEEAVRKAEEAQKKNQNNKGKGKKVFCGPKQSYPATNCNEAEASMRKIFKADLSRDQKRTIMKCLARKLKDMKCRD